MKKICILLTLVSVLAFSCKKDETVSLDGQKNEDAIKGKWFHKTSSRKSYIDGELVVDTTLSKFDEYNYMEFKDNGDGTASFAPGASNKLPFKYNILKDILTVSVKNKETGMILFTPYEILKFTNTELRLKYDHSFTDGEEVHHRDISEEYYTR